MHMKCIFLTYLRTSIKCFFGWNNNNNCLELSIQDTLFIKLLLFRFIIVSLWVDIYFIVCFDIHSFLYSLWENMMKFIMIWD